MKLNSLIVFAYIALLGCDGGDVPHVQQPKQVYDRCTVLREFTSSTGSIQDIISTYVALLDADCLETNTWTPLESYKTDTKRDFKNKIRYDPELRGWKKLRATVSHLQTFTQKFLTNLNGESTNQLHRDLLKRFMDLAEKFLAAKDEKSVRDVFDLVKTEESLLPVLGDRSHELLLVDDILGKLDSRPVENLQVIRSDDDISAEALAQKLFAKVRTLNMFEVQQSSSLPTSELIKAAFELKNMTERKFQKPVEAPDRAQLDTSPSGGPASVRTKFGKYRICSDLNSDDLNDVDARDITIDCFRDIRPENLSRLLADQMFLNRLSDAVFGTLRAEHLTVILESHEASVIGHRLFSLISHNGDDEYDVCRGLFNSTGSNLTEHPRFSEIHSKCLANSPDWAHFAVAIGYKGNDDLLSFVSPSMVEEGFEILKNGQFTPEQMKLAGSNVISSSSSICEYLKEAQVKDMIGSLKHNIGCNLKYPSLFAAESYVAPEAITEVEVFGQFNPRDYLEKMHREMTDEKFKALLQANLAFCETTPLSALDLEKQKVILENCNVVKDIESVWDGWFKEETLASICEYLNPSHLAQVSPENLEGALEMITNSCLQLLQPEVLDEMIVTSNTDIQSIVDKAQEIATKEFVAPQVSELEKELASIRIDTKNPFKSDLERKRRAVMEKIKNKGPLKPVPQIEDNVPIELPPLIEFIKDDQHLTNLSGEAIQKFKNILSTETLNKLTENQLAEMRQVASAA